MQPKPLCVCVCVPLNFNCKLSPQLWERRSSAAEVGTEIINNLAFFSPVSAARDQCHLDTVCSHRLWSHAATTSPKAAVGLFLSQTLPERSPLPTHQEQVDILRLRAWGRSWSD